MMPTLLATRRRMEAERARSWRDLRMGSRARRGRRMTRASSSWTRERVRREYESVEKRSAASVLTMKVQKRMGVVTGWLAFAGLRAGRWRRGGFHYTPGRCQWLGGLRPRGRACG